MKTFLTAALLLSIAISIAGAGGASERARFGGTFLGGVVVDDGVVLASDSRSTFQDVDGRAYGYVDGMQKIYVSNRMAVAVSGLTSVDGELFGSFVERNSFLLIRAVDEVLFGFSVWLPFQNNTNILLLSAGFLDGKPAICARSPSRPLTCRSSGFIASKSSESLQAWMSSLRSIPKAADAAAALRRAIELSGASDPTVGGPIHIVHLQTSGADWLSNPPQGRAWKVVCDVVNDYRRGRVQMGFTRSQEELNRFLASSCPL